MPFENTDPASLSLSNCSANDLTDRAALLSLLGHAGTCSRPRNASLYTALLLQQDKSSASAKLLAVSEGLNQISAEATNMFRPLCCWLHCRPAGMSIPQVCHTLYLSMIELVNPRSMP